MLTRTVALAAATVAAVPRRPRTPVGLTLGAFATGAQMAAAVARRARRRLAALAPPPLPAAAAPPAATAASA